MNQRSIEKCTSIQAGQLPQRHPTKPIGVMFVWNIADPNWMQANEQYWWSITNLELTPRPPTTRSRMRGRVGCSHNWELSQPDGCYDGRGA